MGVYQEKYTREYFTGVDKDGVPLGYGAEKEIDANGLWQLRSHDRKILEAVDFNGKLVLDIGFGRGEAICHAYMNGATHCVGVDFAEAAINLARELIANRNLPEAELYQSDAYTFICEYAKRDPSIGTPKFEIVIMLDFIEHVPRAELRKLLDCLKNIITPNCLLVINTPEYKYDNDVSKNGFDERNMEDCTDTSDIIPETKGMHCNKYTIISLQRFMSECGFVNISEAHFFVNKSLFGKNTVEIELFGYSDRWENVRELKVPLKNEYLDDIIEFPYKISEIPAYLKFDQGNMFDLTLLLTNTYREIVYPGGNYDTELFATLKQEEIENKIIFDVGAFIGVNSLLFAKASSPSGKVIAFEPNPWNRNRLFLNLSHNKELAHRIRVYDFVLGDVNDVITMKMSSDIDKGYSSTSRIRDSHPKLTNEVLPEGFFDMDVQARTLDRFVDTTGIVPDIIKLDIEGAEYSFLRGGLETIQTYKPVLFIELHSEFCALQCSMVLQDLRYQILILKEELDNRLMIKAIPGVLTTGDNQLPLHNRYLDIVTNQYEIVRELSSLYNKELSEYHALQTEYHDIKAKYLELQAMNNTSNLDIQRLQEELKDLQNSHEALKSEFQRLQDALKGLQVEYEATKSNFQQLRVENQGLQVDHEALKSDFQVLQLKHQGIQADYEAIKPEYQKIKGENEELKLRMQGIQSELISLLNTRSIRYIKKIKALLVKLGIRKSY